MIEFFIDPVVAEPLRVIADPSAYVDSIVASSSGQPDPMFPTQKDFDALGVWTWPVWIMAQLAVWSVVGFIAYVIFVIAKAILRIPARIAGWFMAEAAWQGKQTYRRKHNK